MIVIIILGSGSLAFYIYMSNSMEQREIENLSQLTTKTAEQLNSMIMEMDRIAVYALSNPSIKRIFGTINEKNHSSNYFEQGVTESSIIFDSLISINSASSSPMRISLYNKLGDYVSMGIPDSPDIINQYTASSNYSGWYNKLFPGNIAKRILPPHRDYWSANRDMLMLSLLREIKDFDTYISYGVVEVQQPYAKLKEACTLDKLQGVNTFLVSSSNELIYPAEQSAVSSITGFYLRNIPPKSTDVIKLFNPTNHKRELVSYASLPFPNWVLVMVKSEGTMLEPVKSAGIILITIAVSIISLALIIIYIMASAISKPIKTLRKSLMQVSIDNLNVSIDDTSNNNELVQLNKSFDIMFKRLKDSMDQVVHLRSQEMKAHLLALQSQMDPHFLYNMLAIISAASQESGNEKIVEMCCKLSSMLRYVTSYGDSFVTLKDELEHAQNYLELMKERYEDHFSFNINANEESLETKVPKLILQPLLENCFQHGFSETKPPWNINISIMKNGSNWLIEVYDNGKGFTENALSMLEEKAGMFLKNPSSRMHDLKIGGLGLLNTYTRLKLLYGEKMRFEMENSSSKGTKVAIGGIVND